MGTAMSLFCIQILLQSVQGRSGQSGSPRTIFSPTHGTDRVRKVTVRVRVRVRGRVRGRGDGGGKGRKRKERRE